MTTEDGSDAWYYDERSRKTGTGPTATKGDYPGWVWSYGVEVWCNMQG